MWSSNLVLDNDEDQIYNPESNAREEVKDRKKDLFYVLDISFQIYWT